ncbi:hypothetical protein FQV39_22600 [Bosea sp. F3-2]|uniref:hypothetical protein n=1 Tax=Bosea sp. F3-2 TaxID=2599640 RepID=UPI0011EC1A1F|nr:hypothetical protein [Bosea sp. F3-2]QEL25076.1 hypothetical protein FQV39_22600 [Bosea sp. F3-2]
MPSAPICTFDWGRIQLPPFHAGDNFQEAWALYEALRLLSDVTSGLINQPRYFVPDKKLTFNTAGRCLDALEDAAVQIVKNADVANPGRGYDQEYRARIILDSEVRSCDGVGEVAQVAARLAKEEAAAEYAWPGYPCVTRHHALGNCLRNQSVSC